MSPRNQHSAAPKYWSTLAELHGDASALAVKQSEFFSKPQEFFDKEDATKHSLTGNANLLSEAAGFVELKVLEHSHDDDEDTNGFSRRDFLKISGAAMVFATAGCGLRPMSKIMPYVNAPEEIIPGVANYYASTMLDGSGTGVLIKTREGRPIKLEGNPDHPLSQGRLSARGQFEIFNLYDPDRLTGPVILDRSSKTASVLGWDYADSQIADALKNAGGKIVLLTGTIHGPARMRVIREFLAAFPGSKHVMYDAWGTEDDAVYHFDKAEYVLCLESDPLGTGNLEWEVGFGKNRKVRDGKLNKLVSFESHMSLTGSNADERFKIRPGDGVSIGYAIVNLGQAITSREASVVESECGLLPDTIARIAQEIRQHRGKVIVMGGASEALNAVAARLNSDLGSYDETISGGSNQSRGSLAGMLNLLNDMNAGQVNVLITWGTNPAFSLPASAGVEAAFSKVQTIVSLSDRADETGILASYVLPNVHWLENWGDAEPHKDLLSLTQPAIYPLHDNRSAEQSLIKFAQVAGAGDLGKTTGGWHEFLMDTWQKEIYATGNYPSTFEQFWNSALRDGVVDRRNESSSQRTFDPGSLSSVSHKRTQPGLVLNVVPAPYLKEDGSGNNAWLLELPDPVSKISWSNYASMSPKTARDHGLEEGDYIMLSAGNASVEIQVHIQVGDTDDVVTVQSGWGRTRVGRVGDGVGANAFSLCSLDGLNWITSGQSCSISKTGRWEELPCVQGHQYMEGRHIAQEATFEEYQKNPEASAWHEHENVHGSMWPEHAYTGNRWGMSIDPTSCTGCNACIAACQVENNIPVVGREQIAKGREMHWIRVDRYYTGPEDEPEVIFQPMLCQHCENAPCETVCPVVATIHNDEGLNLQVYNRCVGTRYCSNNCPYKVRRFNWHEFTFAAYQPQPLQLALNPDVTVREKGVMEKCTFCQQRIRTAKEHAKELGRGYKDGDMQTACQQSCPTNAITFGNWNDPESEVSKLQNDPRSYRVLAELNVRPSITYWTKLRNRAPRATDDMIHEHDAHGGRGQS